MQTETYQNKIMKKINGIYGIADTKNTILNYSKYINLLQENKIIGLGNANILIRCPDNFKNDTNKLIDLLYYILKSNKVTNDEPYYLTKRELKIKNIFNIETNKIIIVDTLKIQCTMTFIIEDIRRLIEMSNDKIFIIIASDNDKFPEDYLSDVCVWNMKVGTPSTDEKKKYIENVLKQNELSLSKNSNYVDILSQKDMTIIDTDLLKTIINCKTNNISTINNDFINIDVQCDLKLTVNKKSNRKSAVEDLDAMIGLEPVKKQIKQILNYIKINKTRGQPPLLHFAFVGPSGSGKTECSKILAQIFAEYNILSNKNIFIQGTRTDLVSGYIGQTSIKTRDFLNKAKGRSCTIR